MPILVLTTLTVRASYHRSMRSPTIRASWTQPPIIDVASKHPNTPMKRSCSSGKRWTIKISEVCEESYKNRTLWEAGSRSESISRLPPKIQASTIRTGSAIVKRPRTTPTNALIMSRVTQVRLPIRSGAISRSPRQGISRAGPTSSKTTGIMISRPPRSQSSLKLMILRKMCRTLIVLKALLMLNHHVRNKKCRFRSIRDPMNNAQTFREM